MPRNFARHEQFLRIFSLLEILSTTADLLDDDALIAALKERLGISRLSVRTLHRDCAFLASCGYPVEHGPLPEGRRHGWRLDRAALGFAEGDEISLRLLLAGERAADEALVVADDAFRVVCTPQTPVLVHRLRASPPAEPLR